MTTEFSRPLLSAHHFGYADPPKQPTYTLVLDGQQDITNVTSWSRLDGGTIEVHAPDGILFINPRWVQTVFFRKNEEGS